MKIKILLACLAVLGWQSAAFPAADPVDRADSREIQIDQALGGMEEGSRILSPEESSLAGEKGKILGGALGPSGMRTAPSAAPAAREAQPGLRGPAGEGAAGGGVESGAGGGPRPEEIGPGPGAGPPEPEPEPIAPPEPEPAPAPEPEPTPIIDIDADIGVGSGGVEADVGAAIDPSADGGLLDLDVTSDVSADEPIPEPTPEEALIDSSISTEAGASSGAIEGEADAGLEADVEATGEGDVAETDPASGLSSGSLL